MPYSKSRGIFEFAPFCIRPGQNSNLFCNALCAVWKMCKWYIPLVHFLSKNYYQWWLVNSKVRYYYFPPIVISISSPLHSKCTVVHPFFWKYWNRLWLKDAFKFTLDSCNIRLQLLLLLFLYQHYYSSRREFESPKSTSVKVGFACLWLKAMNHKKFPGHSLIHKQLDWEKQRAVSLRLIIIVSVV